MEPRVTVLPLARPLAHSQDVGSLCPFRSDQQDSLWQGSHALPGSVFSSARSGLNDHQDTEQSDYKNIVPNFFVYRIISQTLFSSLFSITVVPSSPPLVTLSPSPSFTNVPLPSMAPRLPWAPDSQSSSRFKTFYSLLPASSVHGCRR